MDHVPAQLLGNRSKITNFAFAAGKAFLNRPRLAPLAMQVIEIWATAEATIAGIVTEIVGSEPDVAVAMLQAVDSQAVQRDMVLAAAKQVLKADDYRLFDVAFSTINASRKVRHRFVHHMWGYSSSLPDALALVDPKYYNRHSAEQKKALKENKTPPLLDLSQVYIWKQRHFEEEIKSAERALYVVQSLQDIALWKHGWQRGKQLRKRLTYEPLIAIALKKLK